VTTDWRSAAAQTGDGFSDYVNQQILLGKIALSSSGEAKAMFRDRAQALMPPGFHTQWLDFYGPSNDDFTSGFAATSAIATINTGRCGGSKVRVTSSGATGFHFQGGPQSAVSGVQAVCAANVVYDPWFIESCVTVNAITGNGELGLCGLVNTLVGMTNLDGTSGQYIMLAIRLAISSSFLVVGNNIGFVPTTIPIEFLSQRIYSLGNDGAGSIYTYRDGVPFDKLPMFPNQPATTNGGLVRYERSNGGTTDVTVDYFAGAGVSF
jgi:hypothetical protein